MKEQVKIYTDGGCRPNPGPGGWAAVILRQGAVAVEISGGEEKATNNRMELRAAIEALRMLKGPHDVELNTDSTYLKNGITQWLKRWKEKGWRTAAGSDVVNVDLWKSLDDEVARHNINWRWVKGHAGDRWNERVDALASAAMPASEGIIDDSEALHIILGIAYSGKTKDGAWAALLRYGEFEKDISGIQRQTSPNHLHILGAIHALEAVTRRVPIHVYTASDYLKEGVSNWIRGWRARGWRTKEGKDVRFKDEWKHLDHLSSTLQARWHVLKSEDGLEELDGVKRQARAALEQK